MPSTTLDEARLKELLKQAIVEVLQERKDLMYDVFAQVVEDVALRRAIEEGEATETVDRDTVFRALEGES